MLELSRVPTPNRIKLLAPITVTSEEKKFGDRQTFLFPQRIEFQSGRLNSSLVHSLFFVLPGAHVSKLHVISRVLFNMLR